MGPHAKPLASTTGSPIKRRAGGEASGGRPSSREPIAAAKAKAHFLKLLDEVEASRKPITITKRGRVIAQLITVPTKQDSSAFEQVFGSMKGSVRILKDIVAPDHEAWGPEWR